VYLTAGLAQSPNETLCLLPLGPLASRDDVCLSSANGATDTTEPLDSVHLVPRIVCLDERWDRGLASRGNPTAA